MWEAHCSSLHPNQRLLKHYSNPHRSLARAKIGTHYFRNRCFLGDNQLLENVQRIAQIPGIIVQGRYDMVSRFEGAHSLSKKWTNSQLYIVREAGHSATEPAIVDALIRATRDMANRLAAQE
jgi:proline iminopeptidase